MKAGAFGSSFAAATTFFAGVAAATAATGADVGTGTAEGTLGTAGAVWALAGEVAAAPTAADIAAAAAAASACFFFFPALLFFFPAAPEGEAGVEAMGETTEVGVAAFTLTAIGELKLPSTEFAGKVSVEEGAGDEGVTE